MGTSSVRQPFNASQNPGPGKSRKRRLSETGELVEESFQWAMRSIAESLYSVPLLGVVLFVFSIGFPPFDDATTLDLTTHMIQHIVIVMAGVMIAYPLHRKGYFRGIEGKNSAYVGLAVIIVIITFWHLPEFWDAAVLNPLDPRGRALLVPARRDTDRLDAADALRPRKDRRPHPRVLRALRLRARADIATIASTRSTLWPTRGSWAS